MSNRYPTTPPQAVRDEAIGEIADVIGALGIREAGKREMVRLGFTLGAIDRVLNELDDSTDEVTASALGRIRARIDAYDAVSEVPR